MSHPIPARRDNKRGCPRSGQLYCLAVDPLLFQLRSRLTALYLPGALQGPPVTVAAYADDVNVIVRTQEDVQALERTLGFV